MRATVVDLRYRMKEILKALDRNEEVSILYHGKLKGTIRPARQTDAKKVQNHPFFNMNPDGPSVDEEMEKLRERRYRDL